MAAPMIPGLAGLMPGATQQAKIPFGDFQASGLEEVSGGSPAAINVVVDELGALHRRPGISAYSGAPTTAIDSAGLANLHITTGGNLYAVGNSGGAERPIYRITAAGATKLGGGLAPTGLRGTLRPSIAETELLLVLAGGADMQKVVLATDDSSRLNGSPPTASQVVANSSRLIANDLVLSPNTAHFSDIASGNSTYAGFEVWTVGIGTAGFFSAEANPDPITWLAQNSNEVFVGGPRTTQVFQPDPSFTFAPVVTREVGCSAPYSVVKVDESFCWLDQFHRFVQSDGRGFKVLSTPIQKSLDDITTVSDCFGYRVIEGYLDHIVWTFPTDGRTFAYHAKTGWAEWLGWSAAGNNFAPFSVTGSTHQDGSSKALVATTGGYVGQFDLSAGTDLGTPIIASSTTGYLNHNTDALKMCKSVRVALKRGQAGATGTQAFLRWRDRPGAWTGCIPIELGPTGDTHIVLPFYGLGTYRRRQWKFEFSGTDDLALAGVTEDFQVLSV